MLDQETPSGTLQMGGGGRWQHMLVAVQSATRWTDPAVITPIVLPVWKRGEGPSQVPPPVGLISIWGRAMYPDLARIVGTVAKRKSQGPRPAGGRIPQPRTASVGAVRAVRRSHESDDSRLDTESATKGLLDYLDRAVVQSHAFREATNPPVVRCSTSVPVEAVVQLGAT